MLGNKNTSKKEKVIIESDKYILLGRKHKG